MKISVVVPVYNEELSIKQLYERVNKVISEEKYEWEIIFVNDGSNDNSEKIIREIAREDKRVKLVSLTRNFGKNAAIKAGIDYVSGDAIVVMDGDLQHPPELIHKFLEKWRAGIPVIIGRRVKLEGEKVIRKIGSCLYYAVAKFLSNVDKYRGLTDFRLLDRRVVEEIKKLPEANPIFRSFIDWLGFKTELVDFVAPKSFKNKSSFTFASLIRLATDSFVSNSLFPLKIIGFTGVIISLLSSILLLYMFFTRFILGYRDMFSSIAFVIVFNIILTGLTLVCIGLLALYIGSIFKEVKKRPSYVVKEKINC